MTTVSLRSTLYLHLISLFLFLPLNCAMGMPPAAGGKPGQPAQLGPDDLKMLEQMEQEINKFVNTLPPEEQKKFWNDVDELTKVMNNMSEEELLKFMEDVFKEEAPPAPVAPLAPVAPTPAPELPKPVIEKPKEAEVVKPITLSKKQEDALKMIDSLIVKINNFLKKAQIVPDISIKVTAWIKKGKLTGLKATTTWAIIKSQIEELEKNLNKLKDRDPKTTHYKYIDALIADEGLYNNLAKLENSLAKFEPKIDVPSLGLGKLNRHSREALRSVIASLNEGITLLDIPAGLEKIFAGYETTAQSLKQAEEASVKKALTNKPVSPIPGRVGGRGERATDRFGGQEYPDFGQGGFGYPEMQYGQPQYRGGGERTGGQEPTTGKPAAGGKAPAAGGAKPEEKKKEEEKVADDKNMDGYINTLSQHFESATQAIEDNKKLANIERHIVDSDRPYDANVSKDINAASDALTNAAKSLRLIKRRLKTLKPAQKTRYAKQIKDTFKDYENDLNKIGGQAISIKNRFNELQSKISPEKQAGYLGVVPPNAPDSIAKLASGRTLYDIQEKIAEIKEELAAIEQIK